MEQPEVKVVEINQRPINDIKAEMLDVIIARDTHAAKCQQRLQELQSELESAGKE